MNRSSNSYVKDPKGVLRFDLGESLEGPTPRILEKLKEIKLEELTTYPNPSNSELKEGIAKFLGITKENITVGNGSDELIENLARIFIEPNDTVLIPVPTFFRFEDACSRCGAKIVFVKMDDLKFTGKTKNEIIEKIKETNPKLVWLCNPNNPTGELIDKVFIKEILESAKNSIIIVDEAFIEFVDESGSSVDLINEFPNLLVIRTLSKAFGLASLRVGFGVADKSLIEILEKFRLPFTVNILAQKLAIIAVEDKEHLKKIKSITESRRKLFFKKFLELGLEFTKSKTNILLVRHNDLDLFEELLKNSILTADFRNSRGIENQRFVRITINKDEENEILFSTLEKIVRGERNG